MAKTMESSSPVTPKPRSANTQPSREAIALRAYQLYLERGGAPGNELQDWIRAENELAEQTANGKSHRKTPAKSAAA